MARTRDPITGEIIVSKAGDGIEDDSGELPTKLVNTGGFTLEPDEDEGAEKTRLMGVPKSGQKSTDQMVVGWLVVWEGPGKGLSHTIGMGRNTIGRGLGCDIRLDHGDMSISSEGQVAIVFDHKNQQSFLQDLGARNPVYLNGAPLLQPQALQNGDEIELGETKLIFVPFCTPERKWA